MRKLNELFTVTYGNKLDFNKMSRLSRVSGGVNFVGRSSKNNGVSGAIRPLPNTPPYEAGLITVALGGTKLLCSFVQEKSFYTAQNVAVLSPKKAMTFAEKLFMCLSIRHNRFRYSAFGREANRTLKELLVPEPTEFPNWVCGVAAETDGLAAPIIDNLTAPPLNPIAWKPFELQELFDIRKGKRLTKANMAPGSTPFIGAIDNNNGVSGFVAQAAIHKGNTITVNYNGSIGEAFYQPEPFWCSDDVNVLYPRFKLTPAIAIFIATIIRRERYRYSFGRKWDLERMRPSKIRLPITAENKPDLRFMERYISSLPFSSQIGATQEKLPK